MAHLRFPLTAEQQRHAHDCLLQLLHRFVDAAEQHAVPYWIDWGTLLGIYRDRALIPGDSDIDVSVFAEDVTPEFLKDLQSFSTKQTALYQSRAFESPSSIVEPCWFELRLFDSSGMAREDQAGNCIQGDAFIYYPIEIQGAQMRVYRIEDVYIAMPNELLQEFDYIEFSGRMFRKPKRTEEYLERAYGPRWKLRDPNYTGNPNTIASELGIPYRYSHSSKRQVATA